MLVTCWLHVGWNMYLSYTFTRIKDLRHYPSELFCSIKILGRTSYQYHSRHYSAIVVDLTSVVGRKASDSQSATADGKYLRFPQSLRGFDS